MNRENKLDKKWQLKIICLVLAIVLWFVIINEQNPISEGTYTVPVAVENLDSQYITSNVPKTIYVRLSGPRNTIINVGPSDIKAYVDMSNAQEGKMDVPIHLELPAGTELKKQSMTTAEIMVDVYTVQEFPLTTHLIGKLGERVSISTMKLVPDKVVISGARRLIKTVDKAVVDIPVDQRSDDFSVMAQIHLVSADGSRVEGLELTPWQSNVKVTVSRNAVSKNVPVNVTTYGDVAHGYTLKSITADPAKVTVQGDADVVNGMTKIDLLPVPIEGLDKNKEWKVFVPSTDGIVVEPNLVEVKVTITSDT